MVRDKYEEQLIKLQNQMSTMGRKVSSMIESTVEALKTCDIDIARGVVEQEQDVKELERSVENRCIKLIMKQQPVATDLRVISSSLKLVTDMERIGRQAVSICEIIIELLENGIQVNYENLIILGDETKAMVEEAVLSFVNKDLDLVKKVIEADNLVDQKYEIVKQSVVEDLKTDKYEAETLTSSLLIGKYFEKIGDHSENIAGWVYYSITGDNISSK